MAIPTITGISPVSGSTKGGNVVQIQGTNFRLPPPPPAGGYLGGPAQVTVSVKFEGVECPWAEAASDSLILCRVPQWEGPDNPIPVALDVRVANLDDLGAEIPTENTTSPGAYTISRGTIATKCFLMRVCEEVILKFRRHLLENTHMTMSRDFDSDPVDLARKLAELPVVYLIGPNTPLNRFHSINQEPCQEHPTELNEYLRKAPPVTTDLDWSVRIFANNMHHLLGLQQAFLLLFRDVVEVVIDGGSYQMMMPFGQYPTITTVPNQSDIFSLRGAFVIKGVHIDEESGTIIERGYDIIANDGEPILDIQAL